METTAKQIIDLIGHKRQGYITQRESMHRSRQKEGKPEPSVGMKALSKKVGLLTDLLNEIDELQ